MLVPGRDPPFRPPGGPPGVDGRGGCRGGAHVAEPRADRGGPAARRPRGLRRPTSSAFNRWLDEEWGFDYEHRIFAAPWLTLVDLDRAVAELDGCSTAGPGRWPSCSPPSTGRSLGDPYFDPIWARLAEAGVPVAFHGAESGYNQLLSVALGRGAQAGRPPAVAVPTGGVLRERPIMDTLADARAPQRVRAPPRPAGDQRRERLGLGAGYLLRVMEHGVRSGQYGDWIGGRFDDRPSDIFRAARLGGPLRRRRHPRAGRADRRRPGAARLGLPPPRGSSRPRPLSRRRRPGRGCEFGWSPTTTERRC